MNMSRIVAKETLNAAGRKSYRSFFAGPALAACVAVASGASALATTITGPFVPNSGSWTLLSNGNFETGDTTGFTLVFTGVTSSIAAGASYAYAGNYGAALTYHAGLSGFGIGLSGPAMTFAEVPNDGQTWVLSAFVRSAANGAVTQGRLDRFGALNSNTPIDTTNPDWQFVYEEFTNDQSGFWYPRLVLTGDGSNLTAPGEAIYIDEFALTPKSRFVLPTVGGTNVPEASSTVSLLGLACAAMTLVRWKRA